MRKSKAKLIFEVLGPTDGVKATVIEVVDFLRKRCEGYIQLNFPEPVTIEPILRNRKPKAPKPERKARKANSQQQPEVPQVVSEHGAIS